MDGVRSWRHIPRRFQRCLKEYVRRPDRLFEAMEDKLDTSVQCHHLSIQFGYDGHNEWEQRPLSISFRRQLESPDLIPDLSWDSISSRYKTALRYRRGSWIRQHGPAVDIWSVRKEDVGSTSLPDVQNPCPACVGLSTGGQCLYCGQSLNGLIRPLTRGLFEIENQVIQQNGSASFTWRDPGFRFNWSDPRFSHPTFEDCLSCYYTAAGVNCPYCDKYKQQFNNPSLPLQRAMFWQWVAGNVCCKVCAFESIIHSCPCCRPTEQTCLYPNLMPGNAPQEWQ